MLSAYLYIIGCLGPCAITIFPQPLIEGSLEVKLPTICRDGKAEVGRVREEKSRSEKIREEKEWEARRCRCAKKGREVAIHSVFPMIWGSEGRKVGALKRRVRSQLAR